MQAPLFISILLFTSTLTLLSGCSTLSAKGSVSLLCDEQCRRIHLNPQDLSDCLKRCPR